MSVHVTETRIGNVLTRTSGFLRDVTSHSLQPYRGCTFGKAACGVGCYVQHSLHILQGRTWGEFLEVRTNVAESYRENFPRESKWARKSRGSFSIFCSSSTDPFLPQEFRYGITRRLLEAMIDEPPDLLILQTHSAQCVEYLDLFRRLKERTELRMHVSIETDREKMPGLPPHATSIAGRIDTCRQLREAGIRTIVTVSPLLPIAEPERFFGRLAEVADGVIIDHYIEGDGSSDGSRTARTKLPQIIATIEPRGVGLDYRDEIVALARRYFPGGVGVSASGFAGVFS